jgi:phospholipase/carboxylesterase
MPDITAYRPDNRPTEGFHTAFLPTRADRPVRLFLPSDYQPKYGYPLVILFHDEGGDEDTGIRLAPILSRRNYIAACPRGPVSTGLGGTGRPGFTWGDDSRSQDVVLETIAHAQREYHVHSERVYLIGIGEGAAAAYRLGLAMASHVAGVVALNGRMPTLSNRVLRNAAAASDLRVFVGHGDHNPVVPIRAARKAYRLLSGLGSDVQFNSYSSTQRVTVEMLRDVNRWIMDSVNSDADSLKLPLND